MSDQCKCSFRIRMVGDGCRHCQPQTYIDTLERCIDDEREENARLEAIIAELRKDAERLDYVLCNGRPLKHEFMYRYQCKGTMNWHDDPRDAIDEAMKADKLIVSYASTQEVG